MPSVWPLSAKHLPTSGLRPMCQPTKLPEPIVWLLAISTTYGPPHKQPLGTIHGGRNPPVWLCFLVLVHVPSALPSTSVGPAYFQLLPFWLDQLLICLLLPQCSVAHAVQPCLTYCFLSLRYNFGLNLRLMGFLPQDSCLLLGLFMSQKWHFLACTQLHATEYSFGVNALCNSSFWTCVAVVLSELYKGHFCCQ